MLIDRLTDEQRAQAVALAKQMLALLSGQERAVAAAALSTTVASTSLGFAEDGDVGEAMLAATGLSMEVLDLLEAHAQGKTTLESCVNVQ